MNKKHFETDPRYFDPRGYARGTIYPTPIKSALSPIYRGGITLAGLNMQIFIYPSEQSKNGRTYNPIIIKYPAGDKRVLVARPLEEGEISDTADVKLPEIDPNDDVFK